MNGQCVSNLNLLTTTVPGALNVGPTFQSGSPQVVATTTTAASMSPLLIIAGVLVLALVLMR